MTALVSRNDALKCNKVLRLKYNIESRLEFFRHYNSSNIPNDFYRTWFADFEKWCMQLLSRLDKNINTLSEDDYKEVFDAWKRVPKNRNDHLLKVFREYLPPDEHKTALKSFVVSSLQKSAENTTKMVNVAKLRMEMTEAVQLGFFVVFSTLTVSGENYESVFEKGSSKFSSYIQAVRDSIYRVCGLNREQGRKAERSGTWYHSYFAVVEEGSTSGRSHIHVVHFCRVLPSGCFDPNSSSKLADKREIKGFTRFWKYGYSSSIAVRFSNNDAYGRIGWRWQTDSNGVNIEATEIPRLCNYMTKYLTKSQEKDYSERTIKLWRIRKTPMLGIRRLTKVVKTLDNNKLELILALRALPNRQRLIIYGQPIPFRILRAVALKVYVKRMEQDNRPITQIVLPKNTALKMLLRSTTRKRQDHNLPSIGDMMTHLFSGSVTCEGFDPVHVSDVVEEVMVEFPFNFPVMKSSGDSSTVRQ